MLRWLQREITKDLFKLGFTFASWFWATSFFSICRPYFRLASQMRCKPSKLSAGGFIARLLFAKTLVVCQFDSDTNGED